MQQDFISYIVFERLVAANKHIANSFAKQRHLLPAIPWQYRQRFLDTVAKGYSIDTAYDCLMPALHLPDNNYNRYVSYRQKQSMHNTSSI